MHEVETKILNVDEAIIADKFASLGAKPILDTLYSVDWFRTVGSKEGDDKWFLRIRTDASNKTELTWKGNSQVLGDARRHPEINVSIANPAKLEKILEQIGLEKYAHQEKYRTSWILQEWRFDFDTYPEMPSYLEIEGKSEEHIQQAITLLDLNNHPKNAGGERVLIQENYGLDWYDMRFNK